MKNHYYLSEMAVSEQHGGGLTLCRLLGDELGDFRRFVHLTDFASKDCPIIPRFADRQLNLNEIIEGFEPLWPPRRLWGGYHSFGQWMHRGLSKLRGISWDDWIHEWWTHECAERILKELPTKDSHWLVVPQSVRAVRLANELWRRKKIRYTTWMMDDHVVRWNAGWEYPPGFEEEFRFHLQHAASIIVISESMRQTYASRFGVDSHVLFGPADSVNAPVLASPEPNGPVRLVYFGAIKPWQLDALASLVATLGRTGATLDVYGLQALPPALVTERVRVRPPVPATEVIQRMREYDGVVIPASFLDELRHLTELNTATKMSECYASGTVPVIVAPGYAAMVQFAEKHGGAVIITDLNDEGQLATLRGLKNQEVRTRLLAEARRASDTACSTAEMRQVWDRAWTGFGADFGLRLKVSE